MSTVSNVVLPKEKKVRVKKADVAVPAVVPKSPSPKKASTPKAATPKAATPKAATPKSETPKSDAEAEKKEVKPRKPTLSAKYTKFIVFGYSMVNALVAAGLVSDEQVDAAYAQIKLMDSVEDQTAFYAGFLENLSASGKAMKKFVNDKKKPPKAPKAAKERKPRAKKADSEPKSDSDTKVSKTKSDSDTKVSKTKSDTEVETKAPKEKKPRAKKADSEPPAPKEKKPRAKKNVTVESDAATDVISNLVAAANHTPLSNHDDDDDDDDEVIHTRETIIDGQSFLIDQDNNLYDPLSHAFLRTL
jgi:hypothetical protein